MKKFRALALALLDLLGRASKAFFGRRNPPAAPFEAPKFLLLRTDHLGDVLMSTALIGQLRKAFPDCQVDVAVKRYSVAALAGNPKVSGIFVLNTPWTCHSFQARDGWRATLRKTLKLRQRKYDFVLALQEDFRTNLLAAFISGWPRGRHKAGLSLGLARAGCASFLDLPVALPPEPVHAVARNLAFLGPLGAAPQDPRLEFNPLPSYRPGAMARLKKAMTAAGFSVDKGIPSYVAVHAGAGAAKRCLPAPKLARILDLAAGKGLTTVFIGGSEDRMRSDEVAMKMATPACRLTGLTLDETAWVIKGSKALLCHDTGTMHLCCALGHPCVAIFGPSDERVWGPWSPRATIVLPRGVCCRPCGSNPTCESLECLGSIDENEVVDAIFLMGGPHPR